MWEAEGVEEAEDAEGAEDAEDAEDAEGAEGLRKRETRKIFPILHSQFFILNSPFSLLHNKPTKCNGP
ncbi:MAG: hypothetical protein F6J92_14605 [Symploca sp. SIO1A3]|nr:hypothetical protein [Symploca sp. SIO1A3]